MRGVGREGARGWMSSSLQKRGKGVRCSAVDEASTCTQKDENRWFLLLVVQNSDMMVGGDPLKNSYTWENQGEQIQQILKEKILFDSMAFIT